MDELPTYDSHLLPFHFYLLKSHVLMMAMPTKKIHHKPITKRMSKQIKVESFKAFANGGGDTH